MKAAFDLAEARMNVVVYEAEGQVGGRVRSATLGDEVVDLGAESFEAGEQSEWVREFNDRHVFPPDYELIDPFAEVERRLYWYPEGELTAADVDTVMFTAGARRAVEVFDANVESTQDVAVSQGADLDPLTARVAFQVSHLGAFSESIEPSRYSAQDRSRNRSEGADLRPFLDDKPIGIGNLFLTYGSKLADVARIRTSVSIVAIERRLEGGWRIRLSDFSEEAYDAVIVTVSAAVLAREQLPLPASLRTALRDAFEGIEIGGYTKVGMLWPTAATKLGSAAAWYFYVDRQSTSAWQVTKMKDSNVLVAAVAGSTARDLSLMRTIELAAEVVRRTLEPARDAEQTIISPWMLNPNFHGAYSYSRVGAGGARPALLRTLEGYRANGIFLAGEALSLPLYGSLEATWNTGSAAAAQCIEFLGG